MGRGRNTFTGNESTLTVHALCTMVQIDGHWKVLTEVRTVLVWTDNNADRLLPFFLSSSKQYNALQ